MPHQARAFRRLALTFAGAFALALSTILVPAGAAPEDVLATVDGTPITEAELELVVADLGQQLASLPEDQRRAAALAFLVEVRLFNAAATKAGLDKTEDFQRRTELLRQRALHTGFVEAEIADKITEDMIRARYDQEIAGTAPVNEVRARHILVESREEAVKIIAELDGGADFAELATARSKDPSGNGGDLGYFGPGQMVGPFEEAAFALDVGAHSSEPVESQFGWHVIKVEDKRSRQPPAYEAVKEQIRALLFRDNYTALVDRLRDAAEIEVLDGDLKEGMAVFGR